MSRIAFASFLLLGLTVRGAFGEDLRHRFGETFTRPEQIPYAENNPSTPEKLELGRILFFDQRFSKARNQSCASCHHAGLGWEMGISKALGAQEMPRKSPTLYNLAWSDLFFWDGRAATLPEQFVMALGSPKALALSKDELEARLNAVEGYRAFFKAAFGQPKVTVERVGLALDIYQRSLRSGVAPFDRWLAGDDRALTRDQLRGAELFIGKANCVACHSGWNFTDNGFHDIGLNDEDVGRGKILNLPVMSHAFKTPTLRSIARRAPYMHAGQLTTLEDVVAHYARGGVARRPSLAPEVKPIKLSARERGQLVEFLRGLTGDDAPTVIPQIPF